LIAVTQRLQSFDPAHGRVVWEGEVADAAACAAALDKARAAFPAWARTSLEERVAIAQRYATLVKASPALAELISAETGKLLWETRTEQASMAGKVAVSIAAQAERTGTRSAEMPFGSATLRHRPHGVMAVLGPYNFPGHLPNGHIVPALLAGNTVVFKPSELTPATGAAMVGLWREAGLPAGVLNIVQGGRETGEALLQGPIDGLLFTGSAAAGQIFRRQFADRPDVILALELGGNNPLVAWDGDPAAVASLIVHSAFVTSGQRCSCARRLILPEGAWGDAVVEALVDLARRLPIAAWDEPGEAFMGPLVGDIQARAARGAVQGLIDLGARPILSEATQPGRREAFFAPVILDVTGLAVPDREVFAPVLSVRRVPDFAAALASANATAVGLSAGLVSADPALWEEFRLFVRAGVVNWNRPTTGAAANMPFGGLGDSGNHRPSAYYAADYCAWPMASFEAADIAHQPVPGIAS
jgi:succinylglutamic semialdehyde dehydrogenase